MVCVPTDHFGYQPGPGQIRATPDTSQGRQAWNGVDREGIVHSKYSG